MGDKQEEAFMDVFGLLLSGNPQKIPPKMTGKSHRLYALQHQLKVSKYCPSEERWSLSVLLWSFFKGKLYSSCLQQVVLRSKFNHPVSAKYPQDDFTTTVFTTETKSSVSVCSLLTRATSSTCLRCMNQSSGSFGQ